MIRKPKCTTPSWSRVSWSTTWHILKNAVCFEHSKCTHIDRCSRLLPPSPANREHTQKWLLQAWRSETERKKREKAFSAAFSAGPFVSVSFPLFCAGGQRQQRQESKVKRWKENEKKQDGLRGREYTVGDGGGNKRTFHRGRTHSQFSHTIGKPLSDRMRFFQPVSNHRYHK